jgi:anti-sigma factor ChrR (cupin superfamily)
LRLNADFTQRAVAFAADAVWVPSPMAGVERRMLERDGEEVARATSIVRYAAGSRFPAHRHELGEEFLVLAGTFNDERGAYPFGTYVRNPPGSSHAPFSETGCALFVKLRQFHPADGEHVVIDTGVAEWLPGIVKGIATLPLHRFGSELVCLVRYAPGTVFSRHSHPMGEEILVLDGMFEDGDDAYPAGTWLRNPPASQHQPFSLGGCLLYVKVGHLPAVTADPR